MMKGRDKGRKDWAEEIIIRKKEEGEEETKGKEWK